MDGILGLATHVYPKLVFVSNGGAVNGEFESTGHRLKFEVDLQCLGCSMKRMSRLAIWAFSYWIRLNALRAPLPLAFPYTNTDPSMLSSMLHSFLLHFNFCYNCLPLIIRTVPIRCILALYLSLSPVLLYFFHHISCLLSDIPMDCFLCCFHVTPSSKMDF